MYFAREAGYRNLGGVDGSPEQVAAARNLGIEGVEQGDLLEVLATMSDVSQDCIVMFDVIEHFTRNELIRLIDDAYRVLKVSGRLIIHAPNGESPFGMRVRYGDLTHEMAFTRTSIAQVLRSSGFSEVNCYEDAPEPYSFVRVIRWILWKCIRASLRLYIAAETGDTARDAIFTQNFLTVAIKGRDA